MSSNNRLLADIFLLGLVMAAIGLAGFLIFAHITVFLWLLATAIIVTFLLNNTKGFLLLLLVRPTLDILTARHFLDLGQLSLNFSAVIGGLTIGLALVTLVKHRKELPRTPLLVAWLVFLAWALAGVAYSSSSSTSLTDWMRLLSIASIFLMAGLLVRTRQSLHTLLKVLMLSIMVPAAFALFQFLTNTGMTIPFEGITNRIYGTFAHPNLFAYYLLLPIAIGWYFLWTRTANWLLVAPIWLASLLLMALTFTRGAWLALVATFMFISLVRYRRLLVLMVIALLAVYTLVMPIRERVNDLFAYNPDSSIQWRQDLWTDARGYAKESLVAGHGTGVASELILDRRGPQFGSTDPHNDYLKIVLEMGLVGLAFYGLLIIALLITLIKRFQNAASEQDKDLLLTIISLSLSLYALSSVDNVLRNTALQWAFWSIIGGLTASQIAGRIAGQSTLKPKTTK